MNRLLKILVVGVMMMIGTAHATDLMVAGPAGGGAGRTAEALAVGLKQFGWNTEVAYNPNCSVGRNRLAQVTNKTLFFLGTTFQVDPDCVVDLKKFPIVEELFLFSYSTCYRADRVGYGLEHFKDNKIKKNVATIITARDGFTELSEKLGNKESLNVVVVGNSGRARQVVLGNEFDYVIIDTVWAVGNPDKVTCIFTGAPTAQMMGNTRVPTMPEVIPNFVTRLPWQDLLFVAGANFTPEEMQKVRLQTEEAKKTPEWKAVAEVGGVVQLSTLRGITAYDRVMAK